VPSPSLHRYGAVSSLVCGTSCSRRVHVLQLLVVLAQGIQYAQSEHYAPWNSWQQNSGFLSSSVEVCFRGLKANPEDDHARKRDGCHKRPPDSAPANEGLDSRFTCRFRRHTP
jgi:hypothetical protein